MLRYEEPTLEVCQWSRWWRPTIQTPLHQYTGLIANWGMTKECHLRGPTHF